MMVVLKREGLRFKTSLGLRIGFLIKFLPRYLRLGMIWCITLSLRRVENTISPNRKPTCAKYGKGHVGECLARIGNCFSCGKSGNKIRNFPNVKGQYKGNGQASG